MISNLIRSLWTGKLDGYTFADYARMGRMLQNDLAAFIAWDKIHQCSHNLNTPARPEYVGSPRADIAFLKENDVLQIHLETPMTNYYHWCVKYGLPHPPTVPLHSYNLPDFDRFTTQDKVLYVKWSNRMIVFRLTQYDAITERERDDDPVILEQQRRRIEAENNRLAASYGMDPEDYRNEIEAIEAYLNGLYGWMDADAVMAHSNIYTNLFNQTRIRVADFIEQHGLHRLH